MTSSYAKELPVITREMEPFWKGIQQLKLMVYRCLNCEASYWPAVNCPSCSPSKMEWVEAKGRGELFTFTIVHQAYHPAWEGEAPYNVAWIKLDEGPILVSNMVGCKNEDLFIGMKVQVTFERVSPEFVLPRFKPLLFT